MKIKRAGKLFIQLTDLLYLEKLPKFVCDEIPKREYISDCFIIFENKESIDFLEKKEEIIDYDTVCNLTNLELCELIISLYKQLDQYCQKFLNSSEITRKRLLNTDEYNSKISTLKYKISTLEFYKDNRSKYTNCSDCALECSPFPYMCDGCNQSDPADYIRFIPSKLLRNDKRLNFIKI